MGVHGDWDMAFGLSISPLLTLAQDTTTDTADSETMDNETGLVVASVFRCYFLE